MAAGKDSSVTRCQSNQQTSQDSHNLALRARRLLQHAEFHRGGDRVHAHPHHLVPRGHLLAQQVDLGLVGHHGTIAEDVLLSASLLRRIPDCLDEGVDRHLDLEDLCHQHVGGGVVPGRHLQRFCRRADVGRRWWLGLLAEVAALGDDAGKVVCLNEPPKLSYRAAGLLQAAGLSTALQNDDVALIPTPQSVKTPSDIGLAEIGAGSQEETLLIHRTT